VKQKSEKTPKAAPAKVQPKPKTVGKVVNPSERLATLLRREGLLSAKAAKAQSELRAIQDEIQTLWTQREHQNQTLLANE